MRHPTARAVRTTTSGLVLAGLSLTSSVGALAQEAVPPAQPTAEDVAPAGEIVVTGFRASLNSALAQKRTNVRL